MSLINKENISRVKRSASLRDMQIVLFDNYKDEYLYQTEYPQWVYKYYYENNAGITTEKCWIIIPKNKFKESIENIKEYLTDDVKVTTYSFNTNKFFDIEGFLKYMITNNVVLEEYERFFKDPEVHIFNKTS